MKVPLGIPIIRVSISYEVVSINHAFWSCDSLMVDWYFYGANVLWVDELVHQCRILCCISFRFEKLEITLRAALGAQPYLEQWLNQAETEDLETSQNTASTIASNVNEMTNLLDLRDRSATEGYLQTPRPSLPMRRNRKDRVFFNEDAVAIMTQYFTRNSSPRGWPQCFSVFTFSLVFLNIKEALGLIVRGMYYSCCSSRRAGANTSIVSKSTIRGANLFKFFFKVNMQLFTISL